MPRLALFICEGMPRLFTFSIVKESVICFCYLLHPLDDNLHNIINAHNNRGPVTLMSMSHFGQQIIWNSPPGVPTIRFFDFSYMGCDQDYHCSPVSLCAHVQVNIIQVIVKHLLFHLNTSMLTVLQNFCEYPLWQLKKLDQHFPHTCIYIQCSIVFPQPSAECCGICKCQQ